MHLDSITGRIIGAAIQVHRELGPGLLESAYQKCLHIAMLDCGLCVQKELWLSIVFNKKEIPRVYRVDFLVERMVIVEVKVIDKIGPVQVAQMLGYQKLTGCKVGLLLNFDVEVMTHGIRRLILPNGSVHSASSVVNNPRRTDE
jgi:GxxExxY protein